MKLSCFSRIDAYWQSSGASLSNFYRNFVVAVILYFKPKSNSASLVLFWLRVPMPATFAPTVPQSLGMIQLLRGLRSPGDEEMYWLSVNGSVAIGSHQAEPPGCFPHLLSAFQLDWRYESVGDIQLRQLLLSEIISSSSWVIVGSLTLKRCHYSSWDQSKGIRSVPSAALRQKRRHVASGNVAWGIIASGQGAVQRHGVGDSGCLTIKRKSRQIKAQGSIS